MFLTFRPTVRSARVFRLAWLAGLALLLASGRFYAARAADWATLAQPVGTFVGNGANPDGVYSPATINAILGGSPPFESSTGVTLIRITQIQQYVRFYNPTDPANPSNAVGSWMMRASEVRGLTAAQIRDKFALPALPTNIVQVNVPVGYALYTGLAAPIAGWGEGGGLQNRAMANKPPAGIAADAWMPAGSYVYAQALSGGPVLSYRVAAAGGRAASGVGAYMDALGPRPNSDLDSVYNALDTLLLRDGQAGAAGVAQAMGQFSPARFDALNVVSLRSGALFASSLDARSSMLAATASGAGSAGTGTSGGDATDRRAEPWRDFWVRATGEHLRENALGATPYSAVTAALHVGYDRRVDPALVPGLVLGLGLGYARTLLDWEQDGGDADTHTASLSAYGLWTGGEYFVNADLGLEAAFTNARRRIRTAVTDRVARSGQSGEGASLRLRAGRRIVVDGGFELIPSATAGYALHRQNPFSETGAGDLSLDVRAATAQTLTAGVELALSRRIELADGAELTPEAALGWRRDTPLDSRVLRASFSGYGQGFQSYGDDEPRDSLLARAGLSHADADGLTRFARYSGTLRQRLQAHSVELGCRWSF